MVIFVTHGGKIDLFYSVRMETDIEKLPGGHFWGILLMLTHSFGDFVKYCRRDFSSLIKRGRAVKYIEQFFNETRLPGGKALFTIILKSEH